MKRVLLVNEGKMPHYRIPVYGYLAGYLGKNSYSLIVVSEGPPHDNPHPIRMQHELIKINYANLSRLLMRQKPDAVILWLGPHFYMFGIHLLLKARGIKVIHWGHRRPMPRLRFAKNLLYNVEHWLDDAVILYAEDLRKYVWKPFQSKTFVANNTLNLTEYRTEGRSREETKRKYGIHTSKNIICMGRMQKRKNINQLVETFLGLNMEDVGLILAGPDSEGVLKSVNDRNVFKTGPVLGEESLDLLSAADVYCLPGAVGLSIVDAFYCGLPVITQDIVHGPEIMYLKDGVNGFITPARDMAALAAKLRLLLTDDALRARFSRAAREEIMANGHIDKMCAGFLNALQYVCR